MEFIRQLQAEAGEQGQSAGFHEGLTGFEASGGIADLIVQKTHGYSSTEEWPQSGASRVNQARLGLAMKECFRLWTAKGQDIWAEKRQPFIKATIETYGLFSEIAGKIKGGRHSAITRDEDV